MNWCLRSLGVGNGFTRGEDVMMDSGTMVKLTRTLYAAIASPPKGKINGCK